uniref:NR LBD domain-containing protein n=1 Tax=Meloidogyne javanica TaxID=6303 RepID=A0A915N1N7_MELJA
MDPKAVRPDRDLTGKQRVPRVRKRPIGEELIGHMVTKGDENNGDNLINASSSHLANSADDVHQNNNDNPLKNVSLRELFENRPASAKRTQMCYEPSRMARPEELSKIAHRGAIAAVDWVESLMELVIDSISMVKNCYAPLTIFNFSARTAQKTQNPDILCLCSFSYVPRKLPAEFNGSNHLSNNLIDRTLNELVGPLRKLALKEEEVVALKATIILDPKAQHATSALRNAVQDMLFHSVKELHPSQNSASRFGNLLLLLPTITTLSGLMSENMQFCQVFGWTDPLLNELFNNGDEEKTASYNQEGPLSAFLADEDAFDLTTSGGPPPVSYSPPMLGEKCEMSTQTDIIMNFEPTTNNSSMMECCSNQTTLNPLDFDVGCNNDNDMFFDGEQSSCFDESEEDDYGDNVGGGGGMALTPPQIRRKFKAYTAEIFISAIYGIHGLYCPGFEQESAYQGTCHINVLSSLVGLFTGGMGLGAVHRFRWRLDDAGLLANYVITTGVWLDHLSKLKSRTGLANGLSGLMLLGNVLVGVKRPGEKGFVFVVGSNKSFFNYLRTVLVNLKRVFGCKQKIIGFDLGGINEEIKMQIFSEFDTFIWCDTSIQFVEASALIPLFDSIENGSISPVVLPSDNHHATQECIEPASSALYCNDHMLGLIGVCHRQDQSVFNILNVNSEYQWWIENNRDEKTFLPHYHKDHPKKRMKHAIQRRTNLDSRIDFKSV